MTSDERTPVIQNAWKSPGTEDALRMGKGNIPLLDQLFDNDPLLAPPSLKFSHKLS